MDWRKARYRRKRRGEHLPKLVDHSREIRGLIGETVSKEGLNSRSTRSRTRALAISVEKQEGQGPVPARPVAKWLGNGDEGKHRELNTGGVSAIYGEVPITKKIRVPNWSTE